MRRAQPIRQSIELAPQPLVQHLFVARGRPECAQTAPFGPQASATSACRSQTATVAQRPALFCTLCGHQPSLECSMEVESRSTAPPQAAGPQSLRATDPVFAALPSENVMALFTAKAPAARTPTSCRRPDRNLVTATERDKSSFAPAPCRWSLQLLCLFKRQNRVHDAVVLQDGQPMGTGQPRQPLLFGNDRSDHSKTPASLHSARSITSADSIAPCENHRAPSCLPHPQPFFQQIGYCRFCLARPRAWLELRRPFDRNAAPSDPSGFARCR